MCVYIYIYILYIYILKDKRRKIVTQDGKSTDNC